ncbi:MAG TPA: SRPBCC family protein [Gaiellaceae bacterium]|nr:SRPBCC family protein [Gaiellaceae bacterium]
MKIENSFEVDAPPEAAWALLMDVPRVIPCMPGATLAETVDDDHWKAKLAVKLGPISLNFDADVSREAADPGSRVATLSTNARESRGRGSATATIESTLVEQNGGTRVDIVTDLTLTGPVAQYGRGMVQSVAGQLTAQFATCLQKQLAAPAPAAEAAAGNGAAAPAAAAAAEPAKPVAGLRLGFRAFLHMITSPFRRKKP